MSDIVLKNITKRFGKSVAVEDVYKRQVLAARRERPLKRRPALR